MADVILHEYVEQTRAHVQARRLSDAFTLGQHILRYYPKHIETYVVLAQACLEADDMGAATDLFRRVLSADPENVLALAGMALIHENQDRNDEALWYLERAYEIQPTNDELRRELVRVRELYYGTSNERLELTPGALARIYARQGQYAAAINEFRRLLRHESKRYDARVALAETLYRAGRADEAAQLAQNIMQDAPYSLKPNLILGTLWSDNAVAEGQQYLSRAQALDPEQRVARDLIGARFANVPPPRLPALQDQFAGTRPDAQAIGVVSGEPTAPAYEVEPETFAEEPEPYVVPDDIEERLRAAELQAQNATAQSAAQEKPDIPLAAIAAGAVTTGAMFAARETEQGETPAAPATSDATLAEIAAAEQANTVATPPPAETVTPRVRSKTDSIPTDAIAAAAAALATSIAVDKLKQPAPARRTHPALPKVRPVISGASDKLPAWLRLSATPAQASASFDAPVPTQAERIAPIVTPETQTAPDERPDWLVQAQAPGTPSAVPDTDLPDWLRTAAALDLAKQTVTPTPAETATTAPAQTTGEPAAAELPEWLRDPNAPKAETAAIAASQTIAAEAPAQQQELQREAASALAPTIASPDDAELLQPENVLPIETELQTARADAPTALTQTNQSDSVATTAAEVTEAPAPAEKPLDARAWIEIARAKQINGDTKGALDSYERAMHRRPNHLDEIIGDLQELMKQPDLPPTAHRLLGEAYAMAGRFKESLEQYRLAMGK